MALPDWVTDEVLTLLGGLTPKQRQGIVRIVEAELAGESLASLFAGDGRICTETTYYRAKPPGWQRTRDAPSKELLPIGLKRSAGRSGSMPMVTAEAGSMKAPNVPAT